MAKCAKCEKDLPDEHVVCVDCHDQSCLTCNGVVFDPVLAYCQCFLKNYNVAEVTKAIEVHFEEDDIVNARKVLLDNCLQYIASDSLKHDT